MLAFRTCGTHRIINSWGHRLFDRDLFFTGITAVVPASRLAGSADSPYSATTCLASLLALAIFPSSRRAKFVFSSPSCPTLGFVVMELPSPANLERLRVERKIEFEFKKKKISGKIILSPDKRWFRFPPLKMSIIVFFKLLKKRFSSLHEINA